MPEELELQRRLDAAIGSIAPGHAPFTTVMRRGRVIRIRRRLTAAVSLIVVVLAVVLVPQLLQPPQPGVPLGPVHDRITVTRPPATAPPGTIADGAVDGKHWQAEMTGTSYNASVSFGVLQVQVFTGAATQSQPVVLDSTGGPSRTGYGGSVIAKVTMVLVTLSDGETLHLDPVSWRGQHWVALLLPTRQHITRLAAYGRSGEIAYALPLSWAGMTSFNDWLRPGQAVPAVSSVRLPWTGQEIVVHAGPWGLCISVGVSPRNHQVVCGDFPWRDKLLNPAMEGGQVSVGVARADVASIVMTGPGQRSVRIRVVPFRGQGWYAFASPGKDDPQITWTAYSADGRQLGTGRGFPE